MMKHYISNDDELYQNNLITEHNMEENKPIGCGAGCIPCSNCKR